MTAAALYDAPPPAEQAETKPTVIEALARVMGDVQPVGKNSTNPEYGYRFRGIDAVVNEVGPALRRHGVVALPVKTSIGYRDVKTSKGKDSRECTVAVTYRFYGPAGDYIDAEVPGESMDNGDKGTAKAMSVAYRILLLQALCIPTDDPDPDSESYERGGGHSSGGDRDQLSRVELARRAIENARGDVEELRLIWRQVGVAADEGRLTGPERDALRRQIEAIFGGDSQQSPPDGAEQPQEPPAAAGDPETPANPPEPPESAQEPGPDPFGEHPPVSDAVFSEQWLGELERTRSVVGVSRLQVSLERAKRQGVVDEDMFGELQKAYVRRLAEVRGKA
jgi:hypothetical protein